MKDIFDKSKSILEQVETAKDVVKKRLLELTSNKEIRDLIASKVDKINVKILEYDEFLELSGANTFNRPGAFYYNGNIYLPSMGRDNFIYNEFHKLVHEMLHSISDNYRISGKLGLTQYYYNDDNKLDSIGDTINESATEYLTSIVLDDFFYGYANDYNYIIQIILTLMNTNIEEFVNMYFQKDMWLNEDNNRKFNSKNIGLLTEIVEEYDNRDIKYRKKDYNFDFIFSNLLDTIKLKLDDNEHIDYSKICLLLQKIYDFHDWIEIEESTIQKYNTIMTIISDNIQTNHEYSNNELIDFIEEDIITTSLKR